MKHLSEEEQLEHFYSKGESAAGRHLEACAECAAAYAALQRDLAALAALEPPVRDASYGDHVWQSIAPSLLAYEARKKSWWRAGLGRRLSYAAVCALLVMGAFFAGRRWEHRQPPATAGNTPSQPAQRVVVVLLSDHLGCTTRPAAFWRKIASAASR
jgi:anti-sigma factor RsiW